MIAPVICTACGHENREGARFCNQCGESLALERPCPTCSAANPAEARFCDNCGASMEGTAADMPQPDPRDYTPDHLADKLRAAGTSLDGERKQVTVMFADVLGSMDLAEQTDAETWRAIMDRFFAHLCDGVHRFEGTVVQFTGDGIMALFGAPIAHEDHAVRAGYTALHLQRELSEYATELRRERGLSFSVRMGLNSGEVVVGGIGEDLRVDYTAIGHTVGLAQRMESLAEPGKAYLTEHTAALLEGYFELRDLGPFEVKGVRDPVGVSELVGTGAARTRLDRSRARGYSRFVGRDREMAVLEEALERALAGDGNVVALVGEAGVGKSRLCDEFVQRCRAHNLAVYSASGAAHARNVPFHAALEMIRGYFGVSDQESPQVQRERIAGRLLLLDPGFAEELPLLFDFVGVPDPERPSPHMNPDARQRRLLDFVERLVAAHSARELAVNLLEDLHWIDGASEVMLEALVGAAPGRRALIVVNHRPEYRAEWMALPHVTKVPLVPLGAEAIDALLGDLVGDDSSVDHLKDEIRQRTGGNPFFIEEVVQALTEDGTLEGRRGAYRLARPVESVSVPPTVHSVLAARIDRLEPTDKALLQAAAVLGREFGERVLEHVADEVIPSHPELASALRGLVAAEFLYERALYPEPEYAFKHPLTQEVAYGSQLTERRRKVHAAVAKAIMELYPEGLDERAGLLAHHWEAAGELLEAARWHARAAAWTGINNPEQSVGHWRKVLEFTRALPEEGETLSLGVTAHIWILQFAWRLGASREESDAVFAEGREMAERTRDDSMVALLTGSYAGAVGISGDMPRAAELAREAVDLARAAGNTFVEMAVYPFLAYPLFVASRIDDCLAVLDRAVELGEENPMLAAGITLKSPYAWAFFLRGTLLVGTGQIARGTAELARAYELAQQHDDMETAGWVLMNEGLRAYWSGNLDSAVESAARGVELADSIGSSFSRVWAHLNLGVAHALCGDPDAAVEEAEATRQIIHTERTGLEAEPWALRLLADAQCRRGEPEAAVVTCEEALRLAGERGVDNIFAPAYTLLARALRLSETGDAGLSRARGLLDEAIATARRNGFTSDHAIALVELADLSAAQGDTETEERSLQEALALFEGAGATGYVAALEARLAPA